MTKEQRVKLEELITEYGNKEHARSHHEIRAKARDRITDHLDLIQWNAALYNFQRGEAVDKNLDDDTDSEESITGGEIMTRELDANGNEWPPPGTSTDLAARLEVVRNAYRKKAKEMIVAAELVSAWFIEVCEDEIDHGGPFAIHSYSPGPNRPVIGLDGYTDYISDMGVGDSLRMGVGDWLPEDLPDGVER